MPPRNIVAATGPRRSSRQTTRPDRFDQSAASVNAATIKAPPRKRKAMDEEPAAKSTPHASKKPKGSTDTKRSRGRPRKEPASSAPTTAKKGRGRPRKASIIQIATSTTAKSPTTPSVKASATAPVNRKAPTARKLPTNRETLAPHKQATKRKALVRDSTAIAGEAASQKSKRVKKTATPEQASPKSKQARTLAQTLSTAPTEKLIVFLAGVGENGELGMGSGKGGMNAKRPRVNPYLRPEAAGVVHIATAAMHCAVLTHDNKILTWGVNDQGALGRDTHWEGGLKEMDGGESESDSESEDTGLNPHESTPAPIASQYFAKDTEFVALAGTDNATFALTTKGRVYGWGTFRDNQGILGFTTDGDVQRTPILIHGLENITSIACGNNHVLALDKDGSVFTFGAGQQNQLGRNVPDSERLDALLPCRLNLTGIISIHSGSEHNFAIDNHSNVWAWGLNNFGQCGISAGAGEGEAVIAEPEIVEQLRDHDIAMVKGGNHHSVAVTKTGKCYAWGRADGGQVGVDVEKLSESDVARNESSGRIAMLKKPSPVTGLPQGDIIYATTATDHSIAISKDGKAFSWGFSLLYQTGLGMDEDVKVAVLIDNTAVREKQLNWAGCGGQFSVFSSLASGDSNGGMDSGNLKTRVNGTAVDGDVTMVPL